MSALALALALVPQELPIRSWSVDEGLPHERVASLFQDSRGFLWIGTWEGLARFDGNSFTCYGPGQGLPVGLTFTIAESPRGELWFSTNTEGIARLRATVATGEPALDVTRVDESPASNAVEELAFDEHGHAWVATEAGLYQGTERADGTLVFARRWTPDGPWYVTSVVRTARRLTFLGAEQCLAVEDDAPRALPDPPGGSTGRDVFAQGTSDGRALLATSAGLFVFGPGDAWTPFEAALGPDDAITATALGPDGSAWIGTRRGIVHVAAGRTRRIDRASGLLRDSVNVLCFDTSGTLWIGTQNGGLACLLDESVETFLPSGGGPPPFVQVVAEASDGTLYASTDRDGLFTVGPDALRPVPGSEVEPFRRTQQGLMRARSGDWWLATADGLFHVPGPALDLARAQAVGPREPFVGTPHEDPDGRLWACTLSRTIQVATPARRELVRAWSEPDLVRDVVFDRSGARWVLTWDKIWRWTAAAEPEELRPFDALPRPRAFLQDRRGWVWFGLRYGGLLWTREPAAPAPRFEHLGARDGLASDTVWSLAEDAQGRLWIGTDRGLDRLEPESLRLRHYGVEHGLRGGSVFSVVADRNGFVWAGTSAGLTRLDPAHEPRGGDPPPVFVRRIEASGEALPIPGGASASVTGLVLAPDQENVTIAFDGVDLQHGRTLAFQTRLDGVDAGWSAPSPERSVHLAQLAPGSYRLLVRAVSANGQVSAREAEVSFRLLAPFWRRPWFLLLALAATGGTLLTLHRARVRRILALARIRGRIAADLHDEVGSGLTQIAILSEVARAHASPELSGSLGELAALARSTKDSMSDLVWAIDPAQDRLSDLVQRMRQATAQLFGAQGVDLAFQAPDERALEEIDLAPDWKRHLLLFFKEAVSNVARHSAAQSVRISIAAAGDALRLEIADDGRGFDPARPAAGHGLASLRTRAAAMGAELALDSTPGHGTRVVLRAPYLSAPRRRSP